MLSQVTAKNVGHFLRQCTVCRYVFPHFFY